MGACGAPLRPRGFFLLQSSSDSITATLVDEASKVLKKPSGELVEDLGGWLTRREPIRRLLRFSGRDFSEFVEMLGDFPNRVVMIIPSLKAPRIVVTMRSAQHYEVVVDSDTDIWPVLLAGILRGMADDYGALAVITVTRQGLNVDVAMTGFQPHAAVRTCSSCSGGGRIVTHSYQIGPDEAAMLIPMHLVIEMRRPDHRCGSGDAAIAVWRRIPARDFCDRSPPSHPAPSSDAMADIRRGRRAACVSGGAKNWRCAGMALNCPMARCCWISGSACRFPHAIKLLSLTESDFSPASNVIELLFMYEASQAILGEFRAPTRRWRRSAARPSICPQPTR